MFFSWQKNILSLMAKDRLKRVGGGTGYLVCVRCWCTTKELVIPGCRGPSAYWALLGSSSFGFALKKNPSDGLGAKRATQMMSFIQHQLTRRRRHLPRSLISLSLCMCVCACTVDFPLIQRPERAKILIGFHSKPCYFCYTWLL